MNVGVSNSGSSSKYPVVVLDAMGVIYHSADDVVELLIPFARENDCVLSDDDITEIYTDGSLGNCTSAELWRRLGIYGSGPDLDNKYLLRHRLNSGLIPFLTAMQKLGIPVACISNDISEWSLQLRRLFKIENYLFNWTISGDVRLRKPDPGIYQCFLANTKVEARRCLFVDDRVKNLDAASRLGFQTLHFSTATGQETRIHTRVANFQELWDYAVHK